MLRRLLQSEYLILFFCLAYFAALAPFTPGLVTAGNLGNLLSAMLPLLVVATGQTLVLITAGIDLSMTSVIAVASVTGALVITGDGGPLAGHALATPIGIGIMLAVGAVIGLWNGACITVLRMPPFIVTLTGMMFFSGFAIWLTQSKSIYNLPASFQIVGQSTWIVLPLAGGVVGLAHLLLQRTILGRWIVAVGQNPRTARVSGVPVQRVLLVVYGLSGLLAGLAAVLITGRLETGSPVHWRNNLLDIVGAAVLGGTSLYGGRGKVLWTVSGVLFLTLVDNSLNLLNLSHFTIMMVKGGIILLAAGMDTLRAASSAASPSSAPGFVLRPAPPPPTLERRDSPAPALRFRNIEKHFFGVRVLRNVSLELREGRTLGLVGENGAGKSTLMNLLGGNLQPDSGHLEVLGHAYHPRSPRDAEQRGIAFIHQELNLFPNLTIAQNLHLNSFPNRLGLIDGRAIRASARAVLQEVGLNLSPDTRVERLSAGERQLVEIAKALAGDASILLLDEPTTSLTSTETEHLFALLRRLRGRGVSIIYISHALPDVLRLCDDIVVLRDGEVVGAGPREEFTPDRMIALMVGRNLDQLFPERRNRPGPTPLLEARGVTQPGFIRDIRFALHEREVLGISGLMGSGRTELARILFGLDPMAAGQVLLMDQPANRLSTRRRIRTGVAFVTESRHEEGLCLDASIADNISLASLPAYARPRVGWLDTGRLRAAVAEMRSAVTLTPSARDEQPVRILSGGNQQKVVLAKWLLNRPRVFILDEPTRGIDVGARYEIYCLISRLAAGGAGVLVISSEIEELIGLCDRILVMRAGEIRDEIPCHAFDRERILRAALRGGHLPGQDPAQRPVGSRENGSTA